MIKKIVSLVFMMGFLVLALNSQPLTPAAYIALYKDVAIREMKRMGVPAAISLAQGLLETECGNSTLVKKSNNHFGIKCKSNWTSDVVTHDDDAPGECFRSYKTAEDSYRDHSNFLRGSDRYSFLFALDPRDYKGWAYGLKKAGYATNPKYPNILIKNIEQYNLEQYSIEGAADVPRFEPDKYKDDPGVSDKDQTMQNDHQLSNNTSAPEVIDNSREQLNGLADAFSDKINFINGSKCVYGKKGTSLLAIASKFDISLQKLLDINDLEYDGILETDQLIFLQKKSKIGERDFVVVQKKETLYDVAQTNGIQLESLLGYNQFTEDADVLPGTKLYLKQTKDMGQANTKQQNLTAAKIIFYEVQAKESLYGVAKKYSVTIQQLKEWNNLTTDELKIGQQLIVSK